MLYKENPLIVTLHSIKAIVVTAPLVTIPLPSATSANTHTPPIYRGSDLVHFGAYVRDVKAASTHTPPLVTAPLVTIPIYRGAMPSALLSASVN